MPWGVSPANPSKKTYISWSKLNGAVTYGSFKFESPFQKNVRVEMIIDMPTEKQMGGKGKGKEKGGTMVLKHAGYSDKSVNEHVMVKKEPEKFKDQIVKGILPNKRVIFLLNKSKIKIWEQFW